MGILAVLTALEQVELGMADVYDWLSGEFADDDDAAGFFARMSREEISHRNLIQYQRRMIRSADATTDPHVDAPMDEIRDTLQTIHDFRNQSRRPTLAQALLFAMTMESRMAERLHRDVIVQARPELGDLMRSLAADDLRHQRRLEEFVGRRRKLFETG